MIRFRVKCSNTLFQREQGFVNLGTFKTPLPVVTLTVGSALRPCQINQQHFSKLSATLSHLYLADGVRPGRAIIGRSGMRRPHTVPIVYYLLYLAGGACLFFLKAKHLNFIVLIFQNLQFFLMIQQIHALATVDLEHANIKFDTLLIGSNLKYIVDGILGDRVNCKGLSGACLSVREAGHNTILENYR